MQRFTRKGAEFLKAFFYCFYIAFLSSFAAHAANLTVEVQGVRSSSGKIRAALFTAKAGFPMEYTRAFASVSNEATVAVLVFKGVPAGQVAVSVFHDEDGDGALKTNMLGIPREGVGVSRAAKSFFGPPSFEDAAIDFGATHDESIVVKLNYL